MQRLQQWLDGGFGKPAFLIGPHGSGKKALAKSVLCTVCDKLEFVCFQPGAPQTLAAQLEKIRRTSTSAIARSAYGRLAWIFEDFQSLQEAQARKAFETALFVSKRCPVVLIGCRALHGVFKSIADRCGCVAQVDLLSDDALREQCPEASEEVVRASKGSLARALRMMDSMGGLAEACDDPCAPVPVITAICEGRYGVEHANFMASTHSTITQSMAHENYVLTTSQTDMHRISDAADSMSVADVLEPRLFSDPQLDNVWSFLSTVYPLMVTRPHAMDKGLKYSKMWAYITQTIKKQKKLHKQRRLQGRITAQSAFETEQYVALM